MTRTLGDFNTLLARSESYGNSSYLIFEVPFLVSKKLVVTYELQVRITDFFHLRDFCIQKKIT